MDKAKVWIASGLASLALLVGISVFYRSQYRKPATPLMVPAHVVHRSDYYWIVPKHVRDDYLKDTQRVNREIQLKPEMGKGIDEVVSIRIASIDQHSPMFAAGFRTGDQILEVNGAPVSTLNRAVNLVNEVRKCEVLTARVQRAGSVVSFKCEFP